MSESTLSSPIFPCNREDTLRLEPSTHQRNTTVYDYKIPADLDSPFTLTDRHTQTDKQSQDFRFHIFIALSLAGVSILGFVAQRKFDIASLHILSASLCIPNTRSKKNALFVNRMQIKWLSKPNSPSRAT